MTSFFLLVIWLFCSHVFYTHTKFFKYFVTLKKKMRHDHEIQSIDFSNLFCKLLNQIFY